MGWLTGASSGSGKPSPAEDNSAKHPTVTWANWALYLDEDDDGNPTAYRSITLGSNAGGNSFHFHAGNQAGTATITCSVEDPRDKRQVSALQTAAPEIPAPVSRLPPERAWTRLTGAGISVSTLSQRPSGER